jgi:hypothetical protein
VAAAIARVKAGDASGGSQAEAMLAAAERVREELRGTRAAAEVELQLQVDAALAAADRAVSAGDVAAAMAAVTVAEARKAELAAVRPRPRAPAAAEPGAVDEPAPEGPAEKRARVAAPRKPLTAEQSGHYDSFEGLLKEQAAGAKARVGRGCTVALYCRSSTLHTVR